MNFNKAFILGNLTRDPELRQTPSGQSVATFGVATNSFFTDRAGQRQQKAEFHNVVVWGKQAEVASKFLKKGGLVFIEGRMQTRSWQDNQGQTRRVMEIICERMQLGPRGGGSEGGGSGFRQESPSHEGVDFEPKEETLPEIDIEDEIRAEDIPF
jgi:single-strand DNA-binding protein